MSEDRVLEALRKLREADAEREAGPGLEARLVQAFRRQKRRAWTWAGAGIAAALAGLGVGLAVLWSGANRPLETMTIATAPAPVPPEIIAPASPKSSPPPHEVALREVLTEFFPLMDVPPPFERGELVRMSLPASALRNAGFVVDGAGPEDPIEADVLIGQEGLARAIRFVSYQ